MPADARLQAISGRLERGEIDSAQYLDELMRHVARELHCARAGLRLFVDTDEGRLSRCVAMFDAAQDRIVAAADIAHAPDSRYLATLNRNGSVAAQPSTTDPVADAALARYLADGAIGALLDMGFIVNGALLGCFSCEQLGASVAWTQRQTQTLRRISARASLTLMHVLTTSIDTAPGALWETSTPNRLATLQMPLEEPPES